MFIEYARRYGNINLVQFLTIFAPQNNLENVPLFSKFFYDFDIIFLEM